MAWHDNTFMGSPQTDGLWTAHEPPTSGLAADGTWSARGLSGLTTGAWDRMTTIHEAGHAVIGLRRRLQLAEIVLEDDEAQGSAAYVRWRPGMVEARDHAVMVVAGERASLRWLRESGLYTQASGWVAEVRSGLDRRTAAACLESAGATITFGRPGAGDFDWQTLADEADQDLARCWHQVTAVADQLQERGRLTRPEVAAVMAAATVRTWTPRDLRAQASPVAGRPAVWGRRRARRQASRPVTGGLSVEVGPGRSGPAAPSSPGGAR